MLHPPLLSIRAHGNPDLELAVCWELAVGSKGVSVLFVYAESHRLKPWFWLRTLMK